ncbi:MAG: alpha/beta hydrolase [Desulfuromonadaceae bacterium]|nr:alpha/beta hydrolase [Desulfuromonadaceae bacterium]MDD5107129.1 alpha/beta hydrolase [Desulfuromonadaceae bacterium]
MSWYVNRRGEQLWYEESGSGCSVILLHGWCMDSSVWKYQQSALSQLFKVLAPDLRGHGRSCGVTADVNFDCCAEDLIDFCESLDLRNIVLVGWSMGGQVAIRTAVDLTNRVAGMVLISATPCFTASSDFPYGLSRTEVDGMRLKLLRSTQRAVSGFHARLFEPDEFESVTQKSEVMTLLSEITVPDTSAAVAALDALAGTDMRPLLDVLSSPVLIVNGEQDRICLPQASDYLKEHISGARQLVFKRCGHAPFLTHSTECNSELVRFLRSVCE